MVTKSATGAIKLSHPGAMTAQESPRMVPSSDRLAAPPAGTQ